MTAHPHGDSPADSFTWTSAGDVTITMPKAGRVKSGTLRRLRKATDLEFMYGVIEELLDEENVAKTDELEIAELETMFAAWQADAGVTRPES